MLQHADADLVDKPRYSIRNLVTNKEYVVNVTHIRPFYFDPTYVTPLKIAVKDTDETVVDTIVQHDSSRILMIRSHWFDGHLMDHSTIAKSLFDVVAFSTKHSTKLLTWIPEGQLAFERLKALVNNCPKLYFVDDTLPIILYTDTSDNAQGAYLCQIRTLPDGKSVEEPIRFLDGSFHGPQGRWFTIEKEAYAIYWALLRIDDPVGGVHFSIRTDHRNLLFMNNHGSLKMLQCKLDKQHYDETIEHVPGKTNIPADVFSRLVARPQPVSIHHVLVLQCSPTQRDLIERFHTTYLYAHWVWNERLL